MALKDFKKSSQQTDTTNATTTTVATVPEDSSATSDKPTKPIKYNILDVEEEVLYHWNIADWKGLETKSRSPKFQVGGYSWHILLFPKGNNQNESVSAYLEVADPLENEEHSEGWHVCAQFALVISNPQDPTNFYSNIAEHRFVQEEVDWGFTRFYDAKALQRANDTKGPFIVNNEAKISVFVRVVRDETGVLWHNFINYDSRKETGYIGMKNQGATCYMNSLLQSLYCTNLFRKAVYQIPTENDKATSSIPLALQRCFYNLQHDDSPIDTTELTKSFGWDSMEAFMQHDVQEFNRVLQDNLEIKMKGTPSDGAISKLFVGKMKSYIKCINVDYESSRVEDFYDIQLNVKGCKTLQDSFNEYIAMEVLEGENKYHAEGYGLQDANKGVIFESFPPVLHLQLKRFEYDFMRDTMVKINDRHEFPEEINLDQFVSKDAERKESYDYVLYGVLVHSGDIHGGHYFALIKPNKEGKWLRFDDDRVTPVTKKEVFDENFGDDSKPLPDTHSNLSLINGGGGIRANNARLMKRYTNAYMLVYIQRSKLEEVLGPVLESDIPEHLKLQINEERAAAEKRKREKDEMHLYVKIAVLTDDLFKDRQEFDFATFDDRNLQTSPGVEVFRVKKGEKVSAFKQELMDKYKLNPNNIRLWSLIHRSNETVRVDQPLTSAEENGTVEKLKESICPSVPSGGFVKIYMETVDSHISILPELKSDTLLIFLKYFDIQEQKIRGLGHIFVKSGDKITEIRPLLIERAGLPKDSSIELYEEVKPSMIEKMNTKQTFQAAEIQNGDIICFQSSITKPKALELSNQGKCTTVSEYFGSIYNRVAVLFKNKAEKDKRDGESVKLVMNRLAEYTQVTAELAEKLGVDRTKISLSTADTITHQPKDVIPYKSTLKLEQMALGMPRAKEYVRLVNIDDIQPPIIYYDILEVSVVDLESKKSLKVTVLGPGGLREETAVTVLVPRIGTVNDLVVALNGKKTKLDTSRPDLLRFFEVTAGKITKEFSLDQPIDNVGDKNSSLYVEKIPDDELSMDMDYDRVIQVVHYNKEPTRLHSVPFRFTVKKDETFDQTKNRLQQRLGYSNKEWQKVKFSIIKNLEALDPEVITVEKDDEVLRDIRIGDEDALALDHVDKSSKTGRFGAALERGIFIRG
ncbi:unnamed protein product [Cunninghamella echinulata]